MLQRALGENGPLVGAIGLGCMGMSWAYSPDEQDDERSTAVLLEAIERGVTFFDTADIYGVGANESLVGAALAPFAEQIVLATKAGFVSRDGTVRAMAINGHPDHLRSAIDASLSRLGRDVVDLYYLHRVDPAVPLEDSWGTLAELVTAGKVKRLGLSEVSVAQLDVAQAIHPVAAVQSEFSLWTRDPAGASGTSGDVIGWTAEHGAAFVPFGPLGRGFLTGAYGAGSTFADGDLRAVNPRFTASALAANQRLVAEVQAVATELDALPGQVALAWVLAQGEHIVPIPGTKQSRYLQQNIAAADLELSPGQLQRLNELPAAEGARY
jgi:aryl-alcohol dehydrogenase-like predicted oxidoreductase